MASSSSSSSSSSSAAVSSAAASSAAPPAVLTFQEQSRHFATAYAQVNRMAPANLTTPATVFFFIHKEFNVPALETFCSQLPHLPGTVTFIRYAETSEPDDANWRQMGLIQTTESLSGQELLAALKELVPETKWDHEHFRLHPIRSDQDHQRVLSLVDPVALPQKEPPTNDQAHLCHFWDFPKAIKLAEAILDIELKSKKRDYAAMARQLWPLYNEFACYINGRLVYFYDAASKLWQKDDSMKTSVAFMLMIVGRFLTVPFRSYLEGRLENCHPDDLVALTRYKAMLAALDKLATDLSNCAQRQLTTQLENHAAMMVRDKSTELALSFGVLTDWLPFRNGVNVNVNTLEVCQRTRQHREVYACRIDWNPRPNPKHLEYVHQFLSTIAGLHLNRMLDFMCQAFIIMSGKKSKIIFFNIGETANAKSELFKLYEKFLGDFCVRPPKSVTCKSRSSASAHTGFLGNLAHRRLILLDDKMQKTDTIDTSFLKRITTPGAIELARNAYSRCSFPMRLGGTVVFILNPDDIPSGISAEPAQARRYGILLHEVRFLLCADFEDLSEEEKASGHYAIADDTVLDYMGTEPLLEALAYLILTEGGREYHQRCALNGSPFLPDMDLINQFFGGELADFKPWWRMVGQPQSQGYVSVRAVCAQYNGDHPGLKKKIDEAETKRQLRRLHPTPRIVPRTLPGQGCVDCVLDYALVRSRRRFGAVSISSLSDDPLDDSSAAASSQDVPITDDPPAWCGLERELAELQL